MTYYRRRYYRRSYGRRRYYRRRSAPRSTGFSGMTVGQVASKALSIANGLRGIINSELKHYDEALGATAVSSAGSVTSLVSGISQGDTNNTITGNSILMKQFHIIGNLLINASATVSRVRVMLVQDTRPVGGATPAVTDILNASTVRSFLNIDDQLNRFRVLKNRLFILSQATTPEEITFTWHVKKTQHIKFNDSQQVILNDLLLLVLSDESTNTPTIAYSTRLRYYDN